MSTSFTLHLSKTKIDWFRHIHGHWTWCVNLIRYTENFRYIYIGNLGISVWQKNAFCNKPSRHWFQYRHRYFRYIGISNILTNQVVLWLCIAFAHDAMLVFQSKIIFKIRLFWWLLLSWSLGNECKRSIAQRQTVLLTSE
jgi:hypothetical protein